MRTALESLDHGALRVQVPDQVTKDFIEQEYTEQIRSTIRELNLPIESVVYLPHAEPRTAADPSPAATSLEPAFSPAAGLLNTRFRFDNFVVGSCNQFAHAAARAVADSPSRSYNSLFIYGGMVQVIYRMALDQELAPPRMKFHKVVQYSAIGAVAPSIELGGLTSKAEGGAPGTVGLAIARRNGTQHSWSATCATCSVSLSVVVVSA